MTTTVGGLNPYTDDIYGGNIGLGARSRFGGGGIPPNAILDYAGRSNRVPGPNRLRRRF